MEKIEQVGRYFVFGMWILEKWSSRNVGIDVWNEGSWKSRVMCVEERFCKGVVW